MRFVFYEYPKQWVQVIEMVSRAEPHLRAIGRPQAADMLLRAYGDLREDLTKLGPEQAVIATATLRDFERKTRVRPDTAGMGGPRLGSSLVAEVVGMPGLPGSIGVADLDALDRDVPWWITNELGSAARVGGRLFGTFYDMGSAGPPDASQFREHPLFASGPNGTLSGVGWIENPIPARRFITQAAPVIRKEWREAFEAIRARFQARVDIVARTHR